MKTTMGDGVRAFRTKYLMRALAAYVSLVLLLAPCCGFAASSSSNN